MDFDINDREPTITTIKAKLREVNKKIIAYKSTLTLRYNLADNKSPVASNSANKAWVYGNNDSVSCNRYCHGKSGRSWNFDLPANWLGAQCLAGGGNKEVSCNVATPGKPLRCLCKRNDSFPYSSAGSGDANVPPNLYNFNTGESTSNKMTCGKDSTVTTISTTCLNDLWSNAGCAVPLKIPTTGSFKIPGTSFDLNVSGNTVDMKNALINLGILQDSIPNAITENPSACGAPKPLSEMSAEIITELTEINSLLNGTAEDISHNIFSKDSNTPILLNQFNQLQTTFQHLQEELKKPIELDGNFEATTIQAKSMFGNYILYLFLTLFVLGSLIYIFKNPEVGNLDIFMLILAVVIFVYYLYEYYQNRQRS
jgi:hypothetical protein